MSMWSSSITDYGMTSMEADPVVAVCSDPPGESCSDAGCPIHGWQDDDAAEGEMDD